MEKEAKPSNEQVRKILTKNLPIFLDTSTVKEVIREISQNSKKISSLSYIYVIDIKGIFIGQIPIKKIFSSSKESKIKPLIDKKTQIIRDNIDQEKAAVIALKKGLESIPVVDKNKKFLGAIVPNTLLKILHQEHLEDILHTAGIHKFKDPAIEIINASSKTHIKKRLPWLIVGLIGGIFAALVVNSFEEILGIYVVLAAFIPAIVYMADAIGHQSQTIFIRSMSLDKKINFKEYISREFYVNLIIGILLALIFYLVVFFIWKENLIAIIIGFSVLITTLIATTIAMILPLIFSKFKLDPAVTSGPFTTAIIDVISLIVYFGIAKIIITLYL